MGQSQKTKNLKPRNWCLTFFEKPKIPEDWKWARYFCAAEEICEKTGKQHWQAYIESHKPVRMAAVKKLFKYDGIHCEPKNGTRKEAKEYCTNPEKVRNDQHPNGKPPYISLFEWGKWNKVGQGYRSDLEDICEQLLKGDKTLEDLIVENPKTYCAYRNGIRDVAAIASKRLGQRKRKVSVDVYVGGTGTGKTFCALDRDEEIYIAEMDGDNWWDGYNGEKTIVIDDFYGGMRYNKLLRILDNYPVRLKIKGSFTYAMWDKVIITSNEMPSNWYKLEHDWYPALERRFDDIVQFEGRRDWDEEPPR